MIPEPVISVIKDIMSCAWDRLAPSIIELPPHIRGSSTTELRVDGEFLEGETSVEGCGVPVTVRDRTNSGLDTWFHLSADQG